MAPRGKKKRKGTCHTCGKPMNPHGGPGVECAECEMGIDEYTFRWIELHGPLDRYDADGRVA